MPSISAVFWKASFVGANTVLVISGEESAWKRSGRDVFSTASTNTESSSTSVAISNALVG